MRGAVAYMVKMKQEEGGGGWNITEFFFSEEDAETFRDDWIKDMNEYNGKDNASNIKISSIWPH